MSILILWTDHSADVPKGGRVKRRLRNSERLLH
jgi:hypothetical protein